MNTLVNMVADRFVHEIPEQSDGSKVRKRYVPPPGSWDPDLPYGGKVYLARKKKADPLHIKILEGAAIFGVLIFALYAYYYFDHLHFHATHLYANLGHSHAQHIIGQRYLSGKGVEQDHDKAMEWFKVAADNGHPHASYNLAIGHLNGYHDYLKPGEAHKLIKHAADNGVDEAHRVLKEVCESGGCN